MGWKWNLWFSSLCCSSSSSASFLMPLHNLLIRMKLPHYSRSKPNWLILWIILLTGEVKKIRVLLIGPVFYATLNFPPTDFSMSGNCIFLPFSPIHKLLIKPYNYILLFFLLFSMFYYIMQSAAEHESLRNFDTWGWQLLSSSDFVSLSLFLTYNCQKQWLLPANAVFFFFLLFKRSHVESINWHHS